MPFLKWILCGAFVLQIAIATASANTPKKVLRAYGPGGPHLVLQKCADLYMKKTGVAVAVIKALPQDLERKLLEDGDIYYGGAEYMLEEFDRQNPGVLNMDSSEKLHARRIGIVVRSGNPLKIRGIECLSREGVDLLDVKLEKMRLLYSNPYDDHRNVSRVEYTGRQGLSAWVSSSDLDAWVTYKSWYTEISEDSDFIEIPGDKALRYTPVAVTHRTTYQLEAANFINFLKTDEARRIFAEHGWE